VRVHAIPAGLIPTNAFLLTEPSLGEAVLIDAPGGIWAQVQPILQKEKCTLKEIWITHGHWDHTQGAAETVRATGAPILAHEADKALIETPDVMRPLVMFGVNLEPVKVGRWIKAGDRLKAAGEEAEVRHVPGHCPGNVLFYFKSAGAAFVGDALFRGSVGRTDLPGGDAAQLARSIRSQIYTLPDETLVYSGHGPETTVGAEKASNPHVPA